MVRFETRRTVRRLRCEALLRRLGDRDPCLLLAPYINDPPKIQTRSLTTERTPFLPASTCLPTPIFSHRAPTPPAAIMPIADRSRNVSPNRPPFSTTGSYKPDTLQVADELHPVIQSGRVVVITGAANGIGHAAALEFARCVILARHTRRSAHL